MLAADPATLTPQQRAQQDDYRRHLTDSSGNVAPDLAARLQRLAAMGATAPASVPRLPGYAGRVAPVPPANLAALARLDPALAARVAAMGIYVDLTGRPDFTPYVTGTPISLGDTRPQYDLGTPTGRAELLAEDRTRVAAAFRAANPQPAARVVLTTHGFQYVGDRTMALVPGLLVDAVRAMAPASPAASAPVLVTDPVVGPGEVIVEAGRTALPPRDPDPSMPDVRYGTPVDRSGRPAPLFRGTPTRAQVAQGWLGDCSVIATIAAVAGHLPALIRGLFHQNPDGSVDVLLHESTDPNTRTRPTGRRIRVRVQPGGVVRTDNPRLAAYADQNSGSRWAAVLEAAFAALDRMWSPAQQDEYQQLWENWQGPATDQAAPRGFARLDVGADQYIWAEMLTQLTGEPARVTRFDPRPGQEAALEARLAGLLRAGSPVLVGFGGDSTFTAAQLALIGRLDLITGHTYEVVAAANGEVRLRNPWNTRDPLRPLTMRELLDLALDTYVHLDRQPTPPTPPPQPRTPTKADPPHTGRAKVPPPRPFAERVIDEPPPPVFAYYAYADAAGVVGGLQVVVMLPDGPRSAQWGYPAGPPQPVSRGRAEDIARQVFGFELPSEAELAG